MRSSLSPLSTSSSNRLAPKPPVQVGLHMYMQLRVRLTYASTLSPTANTGKSHLITIMRKFNRRRVCMVRMKQSVVVGTISHLRVRPLRRGLRFAHFQNAFSL
jgi:hypothetical protein